jgi:hypothetical protein
MKSVKALMVVNMYRPNDQARKPDLGSRYDEIGISAVAAALHYRNGVKIGHVKQRSGGTDAIQKSDRMGNSGQMRGSRARSR